MIKEKWIKYKFNCWLKNRIEFEMVENLQHMRCGHYMYLDTKK